jgi:hypothetical protein
MDIELKGVDELAPQQKYKRKRPYGEIAALARQADICLINGVGFARNTRYKDTVTGSTSIHELNRLIEEQE